MGLYRAELGIPKRIRLSWGTLDLDYTVFKERHPTDKLNSYPLQLDTDKAEVVEVEDDKYGFVRKIMYRIPFTLTDDMVIVLIPHVDVMENIKHGVVLELFTLGVGFNVKKKDFYDVP